VISNTEVAALQRNFLTENFTLWELVRSKHRSLIDIPGQEMVKRLKLGAEMILQPTRDHFGTITVNSSLRTPALNMAVSGVNDSEHLYGVAYDIVPKEADLYVVYAWMAENLYYRQLIIYPKRNFIHVSYNFPAKSFKRELKRL